MNMKTRRRMLEVLFDFASEPLYIYKGGEEAFQNCTHRSETYQGLLGATYDVCSIRFNNDYFSIESSNHQNADDRIYYFYLDAARYKKVVVKVYTTYMEGETRFGVFDHDGLKKNSFTEENSKAIGLWIDGPREFEFDITEAKGTKILAFCMSSNYCNPMIYEIRME